MTILVTGFGPFPGAPFNPTEVLVHQLITRLAIPGVHFAGHVFRTSYAAVDAELPALVRKHRPQVLLMFGLAARTPYLRVETTARNARSVLLSDVAGSKLPQRTIAAGGPGRRRGRAPFTPVQVALRRLGLPVRLSQNAGRYLCNYAYWRAAELGPPAAPRVVVFVHVPQVPRNPRPQQALSRAITQADLLRAAEAIVRLLAAAARRP